MRMRKGVEEEGVEKKMREWERRSRGIE